MDINKLIIRWTINAVAIWIAFSIVPGIRPTERSVEAIIVIALIFGLVNAIIRPVLKFLTCPLIILTLGLGTLLINTAMFWLTGYLGSALGFGFTVDGFWPAFLGALVVTFVSVILSFVFRGHLKKRD